MAGPAGIDYPWATATGGILTGRQRRALIGPLLRVVAAYPGMRLRIARGRRGAGSLDLDSFKFPDSALARDAEEEASSTLSPAVLAHSYRTYLFGRVLAELDGVSVDDELAYVAALLHDLNLESPTPGRCFAVVGAERAERFALDRATSPERARWIAADIAGHLTVGAAEPPRSEGGFVASGAVLDVTGIRLDELDPAWVEGVIDRYPRHNFKRCVRQAFRAECRHVPGGRSQWLTRYAMFPMLVRFAPFPE